MIVLSRLKNLFAFVKFSILTNQPTNQLTDTQTKRLTGEHKNILIPKQSCWQMLTNVSRVWIFGAFYCKMNNFISYLSVSASVFTLLAISNDRRKVIISEFSSRNSLTKYQGIVYPLAPKPGRLKVLMTICSIWVISGMLALPSLIFSDEVLISK